MLGWKYVRAEEESQAYKVGKYILESRRVVRWAKEWEYQDGDVGAAGDVDVDVDVDGEGDGEGEDVQFDSQDEDECEDLFSGIWSPALARRRRKNKEFSRR